MVDFFKTLSKVNDGDQWWIFFTKIVSIKHANRFCKKLRHRRLTWSQIHVWNEIEQALVFTLNNERNSLEYIYLKVFGKLPPKIFWALLNGVDETPPYTVNPSSNALFQSQYSPFLLYVYTSWLNYTSMKTFELHVKFRYWTNWYTQ